MQILAISVNRCTSHALNMRYCAIVCNNDKNHELNHNNNNNKQFNNIFQCSKYKKICLFFLNFEPSILE